MAYFNDAQRFSYAFLHDDICWCANDECPHTACERNQANRLIKDGYFTAAVFQGTEACPLEKKKEVDT